MGDLNIEDFRVRDADVVMVPKLSRRRMSSASFVPGPLPLATIRRFKLSAVFRVYLLLHTRLRLRATPRLAGPFIAKFGLSKRDAQRGLAQLEKMGLVRVTRQRGRASEAELLAVEGESDKPREPPHRQVR